MTLSLVLFDLDGTLTNPLVGIANSVRHALAALALPSMSDAELYPWVGPPLRDSFASLGLSPVQVDAAIRSYREYFSERGLYENEIYDGIGSALIELRSFGIRLVVATSKPTVFAERIVEHFDLAQHFDRVVGAELDGSRDSKHAVILEALRQLPATDPARVVMVGDRAQDIEGAERAGLASVGVGWGYAEVGELEAAGASVVAATPTELVNRLTQM